MLKYLRSMWSCKKRCVWTRKYVCSDDVCEQSAEIIIECFTIGVSVRLSDRSLHREEQKKILQKLPPVRSETRTSGS